MPANVRHIRSQNQINSLVITYGFKGGSCTEKKPALTNQPPFPWELELGVFLCIFTLLHLSCRTMPPDYFLRELGVAIFLQPHLVFEGIFQNRNEPEP